MIARNRQGAWRASPPLYRFLLATHVIVSVAWLGVVAAKLVLGFTAATADDPDFAGALLVSMRPVDVIFAPAAISTILTGVALSLGTKWGLLERYWVVTKLVLTVGVIATGILFVDRLIQQSLVASSGQGSEGGTILGLASTPATLLVSLSVAHVLMLGAATVVSVYKPWGRTWFGRRKSPRPSHEAGVRRT